MKLIVGLGNPGSKYINTRHNAGFLVAEKLIQKSKIKSQNYNSKVKIFKSNRFMNESGDFVKSLTNRYSLSPNDLYIAHDDLDIPLGSYKIQLGKGPKDHNGIKSVDEALGTSEYWRVRVGIDNRPIDNKISGEVYTLENFTGDERKTLDGVIKKICKETNSLLQ